MISELEHAVVIGKFYPFHKGHYFLIHSASTMSKKVTVVVLVDKKRETLFPMEKRADFVKNGITVCSPFGSLENVEVVPVYHELETNYDSEETWTGFANLIREGISKSNHKEKASHLVVSDTTYSEKLAAMLGLGCVDISDDRVLYPISATMIRKEPFKHWEFINNDVREILTKRIIILGSESTGTTTLTSDLTNAIREKGGIFYNTHAVYEYAREYIQNKLKMEHKTIEEIIITSEEIEHFAKKQQLQENNTVKITGCPIIVCDTDSLASQVWHKRYVGSYSQKIEELIEQNMERTLYVITSRKGISLEYDGTRDGNEKIREEMQEEFEKQLIERNLPYIIVEGSREERVLKIMKELGV